MKSITLKSQGTSYQCRGNHIARIIGSNADSSFEREYLARAENEWQYEQTATVSEPGLYGVRNIDANGHKDFFIVFDGVNRAEVSNQDALALAAHLTEADLKNFLRKRKKGITLKSRCLIYNGTGNHVAKITGSNADSSFEREYLARAESVWEFKQIVNVSEPGLYEVRNIEGRGKVDVYIVFDGKNRAKISCQAALALAAQLQGADWKQIVSNVLIPARQRQKELRLRKKELCLWVLEASQHMGQLERRNITDYYVSIQVRLPIQVFPCKNPAFVGFGDPTLCGRKSAKCAGRGSPDYQVLASKPLNKLTRSELETVAKPMLKAYDETAMVQRLLAVVNHALPKDLPNLQRAVELTVNFNPQDCCPPITTKHFHRFLRLALEQGCQLHPDQTTQILLR